MQAFPVANGVHRHEIGEPRWIDAAVVLGKDPTAKVLCAQNEDAYLEAWDQFLGNDEGGQRFARHLRCPICGAYNEMLMRRP